MASAAGSGPSAAGPSSLSPEGSVAATVNQVGSEEVSLRFQEAESRSQSETAGKLGLPENRLRTQEEIQELLRRVQQSIRTSPP